MAALSPWRRLSALGAAGSGSVLGAALWFQYVVGLAPCPMCIWQRWPHVAAIALGACAATLGLRLAAALGAVAMLIGAGLGFFHAGVEQGWWEGPTTCAAPPLGQLSTEELLARIMAAPIVRCDEIAWSFAGISMAGWNALLCLALAAIFLRAYASSSASQ
ncbi:MAG: disulfide bond formation protein B [Rubrimonas sp.]